jgi:ferredoxin
MAMKIDPDMCTACGDCKPVCPTKSISSGKIFFKIRRRDLHRVRRPHTRHAALRRLSVRPAAIPRPESWTERRGSPAPALH